MLFIEQNLKENQEMLNRNQENMPATYYFGLKSNLMVICLKRNYE